MFKIPTVFLIALLLVPLGTFPAASQDRRDNNNFYNGVRQGGRDGNYGYNNGNHRGYYKHQGRYNNSDSYNNQAYYDNNQGSYNNDQGYYDNRNQGGIGPGKGALIGGGGGAVLGALFGGGMKGTIIGGAAGAGIGALLGEAHQNSRNHHRYQRRY